MNAKRSCGECSACCFTHSVSSKEEAVTNLFSWCSHCTPGSGCGVYATRPESCRAYSCVWLNSPGAQEELRPDRFGIVLDYWTVPGETCTLLNFWEVAEGRLASEEVQKFIAGFVRTGKYVVAGRDKSLQPQLYFPDWMSEEDKLQFLEAHVESLEQKQERHKAAG